MNRNIKSISIIFGIALFAVILISAEIEARRGGGRGGGGRSFSRGGSASRGSFSSRSSRQSVTRKSSRETSKVSQGQRNNKMADTKQGARENKRVSHDDIKEKGDLGDRQEDRQEWRDENREDIQEEVKKRQEDRQDFIEDEYDDYWDDRASYYFYAGSAVRTTTYIVTLPCSAAPIVVDGTSYYNCSSTWYQKSFSGSQVTYVTVKAPPGH